MVTPGGLVVLTDRRLAAGSLHSVVEAAVRGGAGWVVLRERDLPYAERRALALSLRDLLPSGRLIVAGPDPLGAAAAVHLSEADPLPAPEVALVGRSCHGTPEVSRENYVTLSPIFPTATKPGYGPALGPSTAASLAGEVPWLALGGIDSPERAAACAAAGAQGIAVLGAVMRAAQPESVCRALVEAFEAARPAPPPQPSLLWVSIRTTSPQPHASGAPGCAERARLNGALGYPEQAGLVGASGYPEQGDPAGAPRCAEQGRLSGAYRYAEQGGGAILQENGPSRAWGGAIFDENGPSRGGYGAGGHRVGGVG